MLVPRAEDDILNIGDYIAFTLLEPDISKKYQWITSSHIWFGKILYIIPLTKDKNIEVNKLYVQFVSALLTQINCVQKYIVIYKRKDILYGK